MLNYQELQQLITGIEAGDESAIQRAQAVSATESKIANQQMRRLEASDLESSPAYQKAKFYLDEDLGGRSYFSQSKQLTGEDLIKNLETVYDFRHDATSTVTGEKERRAGFDQIMDTIDETAELDSKERGYLRGFLGSDFWKDFKSTIYRTSKKSKRTPDESADARAAIAEAADAIRKGATIRQLEDLYEQFKNQQDSDVDIFGVMREWRALK